jgi:Protein of unknown function (DUF4242)
MIAGYDPKTVPRYMIIRSFAVEEDEMPQVGHRSKQVIEKGFREITWEHSHVVVDDDGSVSTYCIYTAPDEETIWKHAKALGRHQIQVVHEIAGDVSPADFPS